jgi:peptidoglycan/xylan/chitin deacetylase (PgdA/CDA1 family)
MESESIRIMLKITIPPNLNSARQYILNLLLTEFLGLSFSTEIKNIDTIQISYENKILTISDAFFQQAANHWLQPESLPQLPLAQWNVMLDIADVNLVSSLVPVIFGDNVYFKSHENGLHLGLDIFGSAFFMLSRYEEVVKSERDSHERFPATASLAFQADFLHRPIVNEYVEILWACMKQLCPLLKRKPRNFRMLVSHDVDNPFEYRLLSPPRLLKQIAGDILKRHSLVKAAKNLFVWIKVKTSSDVTTDPYYTFDAIMDISEKHGLSSAFYFITDHSAGIIDGLYTMERPEIRNLLRKIHTRGHEIGLHTSYNTYRNSTQTAKEFKFLKQTCEDEGIQQITWGGRQHFLRWKTPTTFSNWNTAGLDYDSSLSFADKAGFRCGTCYEYPVYDVINKQPLKLRERPLIAMECSIIDEHYMGLGTGEKALQVFAGLKRTCQQFNGDFTLLWHNHRLVEVEEQALYDKILKI